MKPSCKKCGEPRGREGAAQPAQQAQSRLWAVAVAMLLPACAIAETPSGSHRGDLAYEASLYVYLPTIDGTSSFPADGSSVNVDASKILESLDFTFMGTFDIHRGAWGVFTDLMYVDLGASKGASRDFTIGDIGLPAGTAADLHLDLKAWVWSLAAEYRLSDQPGLQLDLLGGTRYLDLSEKLTWTISGNLGPIEPGGRSGSSEASSRLWDAIVGVRGRVVLGSASNWTVPFYLDVGAGASNHTWQAAGGIAYSFQWGSLVAMWRYLDYGFSGNNVTALSLNGPLIGAAFRW